MVNSVIQPSFGKGELSPSLYARTDLAAYHVGAKRLRNCFVLPQGGASNRPGTMFVGRCKDSAHPVRLIPFQFSTVQTYVLEFGHLYMRVVMDGGYVLEPSFAVTGISQADPGVVTAPGHDYADGDQVFIAGVVGMTQINSTPGRQYLVTNSNPAAGTFSLTDLDGNAVNTAAFGAYTAAGMVARVYTLTTPYAGSDLTLLKFTQSDDVLTLCHASYAPMDLNRLQHWQWTLAPITFQPQIAAPAGVSAAPGGSGSWNFAYVVTSETDVPPEESLGSAVATCTGAQLNQNTGVQNTVSWSAVAGAVRYRIYKANASTAAILSGAMFGYIGEATGTSFADLNMAPDFSQTPPQGQDPFANGNNPGVVTYYEQRKVFGASSSQPQSIWMTQPGNYVNMDTSNPSQDGDAITLTIAAQQVNAIKYFVPMADLLVMTSGGAWRVSAGASANVLTPTQTVVTPQTYEGCADLPPIVVNYDVLYVQALGASVRDLAYNFYASVYTGTDLSVLSHHLFFGFQLKEWAHAAEPWKLVWVVRNDGKMLLLTYLKEQDIGAWTWADSPGDSGADQFMSVASIVEGTEDAVYVVVQRTIPGVNGGNPVQYVERVASRNFINPALGYQYDVTQAWFVDCGLQYNASSGPATTAVSGLDHLDGCTVSILADGNVLPQQVVADGTVTLSRAAQTITIGLPYVAQVQTLDLDVSVGAGTIQGKRKGISAVTVRTENTRGLQVGPNATTLRAVKEFTPALGWGQPPALTTGDERIELDPLWQTDGSVWIEQDYPLPMTILGVIPEVHIGDD